MCKRLSFVPQEIPNLTKFPYLFKQNQKQVFNFYSTSYVADCTILWMTSRLKFSVQNQRNDWDHVLFLKLILNHYFWNTFWWIFWEPFMEYRRVSWHRFPKQLLRFCWNVYSSKFVFTIVGQLREREDSSREHNTEVRVIYKLNIKHLRL